VPFILESLWLVFFGWLAYKVHCELRKERFNDPQVRAMRQLGHVYEYLTHRRYLEALKAVTEAINKEQCEMDVAYWLRAKAYMGLGFYWKAIDDCNEALKYNSHFTLAYLERAIAYYHLHHYEDALNSLEYVERLNTRLPELSFYRSLIYEGIGDQVRADQELEKAAVLARLNT
jgi:tetratricopeptide (TPR) repeat protein